MSEFVDPTREAFAAFQADARPGPIQMLNFVRLRTEAAYPDGRRATGAQAYATYLAATAPILARVGGRIVWRGSFELTLIGPADERWDHCFIVEYPSGAAFLSMIGDDEYQQAVAHRQAAVADSRLLRLAPQPVGTGPHSGAHS